MKILQEESDLRDTSQKSVHATKLTHTSFLLKHTRLSSPEWKEYCWTRSVTTRWCLYSSSTPEL
eukprot:jgi/Phyca11/505648/fgenesh2_kg.PHYCAscaffold_14_\